MAKKEKTQIVYKEKRVMENKIKVEKLNKEIESYKEKIETYKKQMQIFKDIDAGMNIDPQQDKDILYIKMKIEQLEWGIKRCENELADITSNDD